MDIAIITTPGEKISDHKYCRRCSVGVGKEICEINEVMEKIERSNCPFYRFLVSRKAARRVPMSMNSRVMSAVNLRKMAIEFCKGGHEFLGNQLGLRTQAWKIMDACANIMRSRACNGPHTVGYGCQIYAPPDIEANRRVSLATPSIPANYPQKHRWWG